MRTTVTLEPDVEELLRNETHRSRKSFKSVINDAIRNGLHHQIAREPSAPYRVNPSPLGLQTGIDPAKIQPFADDLDIEHFQNVTKENLNDRP